MKRRTRSVSYRLDSDILEQIAKEANFKQTSTNLLVNQVLKRFVDFHMYEQPLGIMHFPRLLVRDMFSVYDDHMISLLAQKAYKGIEDSVLLMLGKTDVEGYLEVLERYLAPSVFCRRLSEEGKKIIIIEHPLGLKYSEFLKELLSIIFEKLEQKRPTFEITERCVRATLQC